MAMGQVNLAIAVKHNYQYLSWTYVHKFNFPYPFLIYTTPIIISSLYLNNVSL